MSLRPGQKIKDPEDLQCLLTTSGTTIIGDVLAVNPALVNSDGEWYACRVPTAADTKHGMPAVALAPGVNGTILSFATSGLVYANVLRSSEAIAVGDPLYFEATTRTFDITAPAAGVDLKVAAKALEVVASGSGTSLIKVMLGGISGFGTSEA